jgi:acyl-CoA thioester hydrolase
MPAVLPSAVSAGRDDEEAALAARVAVGPGLWEDEAWLGELRRDGLVTGLLAGGVIGQAVAGGGHGHRLERALTAATCRLRRAGPRSAWSWSSSTLDLFACPELAAESGVPEGGTSPKFRAVGLLQAGTMRWKAAVLGSWHDGENTLCDRVEGALGPGQLSLAGRGFFSMDRWLRFSVTGAHLLWRVKNTARAVPFRHLRTLKDGSELVLLRESGNMLGLRRREAGDRMLARLPDTAARLACFTILTRTRRGRPIASGLDTQLVHAEVDWRAGLRWQEEFTVAVSTARVGRTSFALDFEARRTGEVTCAARIVYVVVATNGSGKRPVPPILAAALGDPAPLRAG